MSAPATQVNPYSRQLSVHRRVSRLQNEVETYHHLERNAREAAFASLMRSPRSGGSPVESPTPPPGLTEAFEQLVARTLQQRNGHRLDFTARNRLARHAIGMGLSRFDANLLIARVEHYTSHAPRARRRRAEVNTRPRSPRRRTLLLWTAGAVSVLLIQGALLIVWFGLLNMG